MIALAAEPDSLKYLASWLVILLAEAPSQVTNCTHYLSLKLQIFNTLNRSMFLKIIVQFSVDIPFTIRDNYRSTSEIVAILNMMRKDIQQKNPLMKIGPKPTIIVGDALKALEEAQKHSNNEPVTSLSYSNLTANGMRNGIEYPKDHKWMPIGEVFKDSNANRRRLLITLIESIEYARLGHYKEAIKGIKKHIEDTQAIIVLKKLLDDYDQYRNQPLWKLYQIVDRLNCFSISKINESKDGRTPTAIESFYKETKYSSILLYVKIKEDNSFHRTIHQSKGEEFNNVLITVRGKNNSEYNEERDLSFLLDPNIDMKEDHRVYYVACSRAMKRLFINVPIISDSVREKLENYFDII